jgi:hypothetical protein
MREMEQQRGRDRLAAAPGGGREPRAARPNPLAASAVLYLLTGLGFGIGSAFVLPYMVQNRELPIIFGIRASGGGFIEGWGIDALIIAQALLLVVSLLEIVAGYVLWKSRRWGAMLGLGLFPVSFVLAIGLLLPAKLVVDPFRVALLLAGWKTLR